MKKYVLVFALGAMFTSCSSYTADVTADEGWIAAITDKCPTVAKNITQ